AERRQNHNDQFSGIFRTVSHLQSRDHRRSRRDADQQTLFERHAPRHVNGLVVGHGDDLVNVIPAQNAGNKTASEPLNLVRPRWSAREDCAICRLHGYRLERRLLWFYVFADAGERPARADTRDQKIHAPVRVFPNLGTGSFEVNLRIGRVVKLLEHVGIGSAGNQFLGFQNGSLHSAGTRRKDDFCAQSQQQHAPLQAHGLGHGEDELVAFHGGYKGESDSGVAAGGLDQNGFPGLNPSGTLGIGDHADANAVFYAGQGILAFQLRHHVGNRSLRNPVQTHQRRVANQFRYILCNPHRFSILGIANRFFRFAESAADRISDFPPLVNTTNSTSLLVYIAGTQITHPYNQPRPRSLQIPIVPPATRRSTISLTLPRLSPSHPRQDAPPFLGRNREPSRHSRYF